MADLLFRLYILKAQLSDLLALQQEEKGKKWDTNFKRLLCSLTSPTWSLNLSMLFLLDNIPSADIKDKLCRYCLTIGHATLRKTAAFI